VRAGLCIHCSKRGRGEGGKGERGARPRAPKGDFRTLSGPSCVIMEAFDPGESQGRREAQQTGALEVKRGRAEDTGS
jgi:hypothetical protein